MPLRIVRGSPVPSSSVNLSSFLDLGTASQASTFTARKSDLLKVSKSTNSLNSGSISTLEKSIGSGSAFAASAAASAGLAPASLPASLIGFIVGKSSTSRMVGAPVSSMTKRSTPMPMPPVGGRPYSSALRKSSSTPEASSSPCALRNSWYSKRWRWSMGSLSSLKALQYSRPPMNSSKRSV